MKSQPYCTNKNDRFRKFLYSLSYIDFVVTQSILIDKQLYIPGSRLFFLSVDKISMNYKMSCKMYSIKQKFYLRTLYMTTLAKMNATG